MRLVDPRRVSRISARVWFVSLKWLELSLLHYPRCDLRGHLGERQLLPNERAAWLVYGAAIQICRPFGLDLLIAQDGVHNLEE